MSDLATIARVQWTERQAQAFNLIRDYQRVLLYGGSSSGKTRAICEYFCAACVLHPGIRFLFARFRRQHAKETLWHETLLGETLSRYPPTMYSINQADLMIRWQNGSEIWITGTDDKKRLEKSLGRGVAGIYLNEASQISYEAFVLLRTRLRQKVESWKAKVVCDCNPPSPTHWTHKVFMELKEPRDGKPLDAANYAALLMNPSDNLDNLPAGYLSDFEDLPDAERRRFELGEWVRPSGSIFTEYGERCLIDEVPDCEEYIVGVDLVTYAAVLVGMQRYATKRRIRRKLYVIDEIREGALAHEVNRAIVQRWKKYPYTAYIDHNLGEAGTREFDRSLLADKGQGSVDAGIVELQTAMHLGDLLVHRRCTQLHYELENYHRDQDGRIVKVDDHGIDALRMAVFSVSQQVEIEVD